MSGVSSGEGCAATDSRVAPERHARPEGSVRLGYRAIMHHADVIVCGSGLAGMRAALSAVQTTRHGKVPLVMQLSAVAGVSGSSFANVNDALGILVPQTPAHADMVERRIREIAGTSHLDRGLVRILLDEAPDRVRDMENLGVRFHTYHSACYFPDAPVARVFSGLSAVHGQYADACSAQGVRRLSGMTVIGLLTDNEHGRRVCGVVATDLGGALHVFSASAVILALGGPGVLFGHHVCGPHASGAGYGLLRSVGARLANTSYLQYMWYGGIPRQFVSASQTYAALVSAGAGQTAVNGLSIAQPDVSAESCPDDQIRQEPCKKLLRQRETHCPYAWHMPDNVIDHALLACADATGMVPYPSGEEGMLLMAHAGNGGAVIDAHGQTSVAGLFACGECATGMHGANRIGGAMVLATQVFGHRAGVAAARMAADAGSNALAGRRGILEPHRTTVLQASFEEWMVRMGGEAAVRVCEAAAAECADTPGKKRGHGAFFRHAKGIAAAAGAVYDDPHPCDVLSRLPALLYKVCSPMADHYGPGAAGALNATLTQLLAEVCMAPLERGLLLTALEIVQHRMHVSGQDTHTGGEP